ncbi:hypothetical protein [Paenibacillus sp. B1-33]|uniref:hypothetical protein n=1 Tax=unclassified Paenibacillus TaxID=185978 RepID=UPI003D2ABD18
MEGYRCLLRTHYNRERSRILYTLSCFETEVMYDEEQRSYQIRIRLPWNEQEFLLSKIRFLGSASV